MNVVHEFLSVVDAFFTSGGRERGWGTNPKIPVVFGNKTVPIQVRLGVSHYDGKQPNIVVEPTRHDIEMRLDVPPGFEANWESERVSFLQLVAAVASARLKIALQRVV